MTGGNLNWEDIKPALLELGQRLDHIEQGMVRLGELAGYSYVPYAPGGVQMPDEVKELARAGKTLDAIKRYRELTGAPFEDARAAVLSL